MALAFLGLQCCFLMSTAVRLGWELSAGAESRPLFGHPFVVQIHISHEGGRQMKFLLDEGFQMPVSRAHGMTRGVVDVCGNSTGNYAGLLAKGVRAVEVERGIGAHFPPILQHRCPEQVVFMTVLRDPIAKQIRARWDFRAQKMGTFTLPNTCGHVASFLSLGGYTHAL